MMGNEFWQRVEQTKWVRCITAAMRRAENRNHSERVLVAVNPGDVFCGQCRNLNFKVHTHCRRCALILPGLEGRIQFPFYASVDPDERFSFSTIPYARVPAQAAAALQEEAEERLARRPGERRPGANQRGPP